MEISNPAKPQHAVTSVLPLASPADAIQVPAIHRPDASKPWPAPKPPWTVPLIVVAGLAAAALWYTQSWSSAIPTVVTETIAPAPLSRVLALNGRIATLHPVNVTASISGSVLTVTRSEGDTVAMGEPLVLIDASSQQAAVRQARAALDFGTLAQQQRAADVTRLQELGTVIARTALEDANRLLQQADQEVGRLSALFQQAEILLAKYTISAPIAGTVLARNVEPGQTVNTATILFTLSDLSAPVVQTEVDEAYAAQIALGQPAILQLVGETVIHPGKVSFVAPSVNADTGSLVVKITPDQPLAAPVGLTVTANIVVDNQPTALSIPRAALTSGTGAPSVMVVQGGVAHQRDVTVIDWPAARLIVTQGLVAGDLVITDPTGIKDGQSVKVSTAKLAPK